MVKHVKLSEKISDDDRISELPEPILHHILSFLSTKQAATTSVLSKSWQYQWTWLPNLDISQREMSANDITSFGTIILKIFLSRRARCIRKLNLSCMSGSDLIIGSILCTAVERNVEELDFYTEKLYELPTRLFCCKTLVALKLRGEIVMDIGSTSVHLPSLKELHLQRVKYKDEHTFHNLLGGCPVLDYLAVGFVPDDNFHYEIFSLSVRHVILRLACFINPYLLSKITVSAPALEHFTIDVSPTALVLNNVSSSVHAKFNISLLRLSSRDKYWGTIKVIFGGLCNVQFLELNFGYSTIHSGHNIPMAIFPRFDSLVELKLVSFSCSLPLLSMLLKCSRLEHLTLVSKTSKRSIWENPQCWISPQKVPNCLAFQLTTVKFEGFEGLEAEVGFTQYVLNNSQVLRSMTIRYENNTNLARKFGAFQKISGFVKHATRCQLTFQPQI